MVWFMVFGLGKKRKSSTTRKRSSSTRKMLGGGGSKKRTTTRKKTDHKAKAAMHQKKADALYSVMQSLPDTETKKNMEHHAALGAQIKWHGEQRDRYEGLAKKRTKRKRKSTKRKGTKRQLW